MKKRTKACLTLVIGLAGLLMLERGLMPKGETYRSGDGVLLRSAWLGQPGSCDGTESCREQDTSVNRRAQERTLGHLQFAFR
ncbi:hypothetical protein [Denitromonas ohlonensis]|uniref:Uncharacterized protein n=2 Tax=Denitromonas TaxID=139331 RepID=A0A557SDE0_9RHOO|nr:hypothetical protein [Denitromonas ohlonensis]TVT48683.1 MAG: hypothetical protein FHP94_09255 [Denitromonas halophila]TVO63552.1 hypothetical protein FHP90_13815 [Denitromonas ohlonensis]TVO75429.1 hypothetical protein FHP89_13850 [Denitromonas ohlonensis]TVT70572.1 MAG: hypothetical protein FHP92_17760 [Denitromonas halophila]TVT75694.1 MAG: hypothetical protein FHP93_00385 [Denitromonas halophila]